MSSRFNYTFRRFNFRCWPGVTRRMYDWDEKTAGFELYCRTYDRIGGLK